MYIAQIFRKLLNQLRQFNDDDNAGYVRRQTSGLASTNVSLLASTQLLLRRREWKALLPMVLVRWRPRGLFGVPSSTLAGAALVPRERARALAQVRGPRPRAVRGAGRSTMCRALVCRAGRHAASHHQDDPGAFPWPGTGSRQAAVQRAKRRGGSVHRLG